MYHYVYKLENPETGEFYFGSRSCICHPYDDNYMGSMIRWKPDKSKLHKIVINYSFLTREDALKEEANLIQNNINNPLIRNYYVPNKNFHTTGWGYWTGKVGPMIGHTHTKEVKEKLRKMKLGKLQSEETKIKMSISHKGKVKTDVHKENLSKALKGKPKSISHKKNLSEAHKIPIIQCDMHGNVIKEWNGIIDAERELKITHITDVCKGKAKSAGGFFWKYKN